MMRSPTFRLLGLVAAMAVVLSCDSGAPTGLGDFQGGGGTDPIGGGPTTVGGDGRLPTIEIDSSTVPDTLVNVGDSILVTVRVQDAGGGIRTVSFAGLTYRGNPDLGTQVVTERYISVVAPATGTFPAGTASRTDTVLRRVLFPRQPVDSTPDSVVLRAIVVDNSGLADTATKVVRLVAGPSVVILSPPAGDSARPGTRVDIRVRATHVDGIKNMLVRVRGEPTWVPALDTVVVFQVDPPPDTLFGTASVLMPADSTLRGAITITAEATNGNDTKGYASAVSVRLRITEAGAPIVKQVVPPRAELRDPINIRVSGANGIKTIGFIVRPRSDFDPTPHDTTTIQLAQTQSSIIDTTFSMALAAKWQGKTVSITSFAIDNSDKIGYSVPSTATTPVEDLAKALADTSLVVYGTTYGMPRAGIAGDVTVDPATGYVFVANTSHNRLEVWRPDLFAFEPAGVAVGAEPWGMTISATDANQLLVANSGGTNISRVNINPAAGPLREESRILTRNTIAYTVSETRDLATNKVRIVVTGPFSYSDRPQYIAQSAGGRIYYSTRPTATAPAGTLRYIDPAQAVPDSRQIYHYGSPTTSLNQFTVFNIDGVTVNAEPADSPLSDELILCDHETGTAAGAVCAGSRNGVGAALTALKSIVTSDAEAVGVDLGSLALTDTTFVAWSGDRSWIAFGEGATAGTARVMMANDPAGNPWQNIFFSAGLDVADLMDNASERVFGLALDTLGRSLAVHGAQSYFGAVEQPFHLRMQGQFNSFDVGAGIAFHPRANVNPAAPGALNDRTRLAFVASANGTIEIVDAYYYVSRGRVAVRNTLYGPLRAGLPTAAEVAAGVEVKLYGMTSQGLVVVDVTTADIRDVP